jgi:hypothetical protein
VVDKENRKDCLVIQVTYRFNRFLFTSRFSASYSRIFGSWVAAKTSLMKMLKNRIELQMKIRKHLIVHLV